MDSSQVPATLASAGVAAGAIAALTGGYFAAAGLYHVAVATAALFHRPTRAAGAAPRSRLVVLVPAHDEAALIDRCVRALVAQSYPAALYEILVVADNCTDDTAARARAAGAEVLVRHEPDARGKGRALRWALDRVLARPDAADAVVVVDADSVAAPDFLTALVGPFERGAAAVQGESLLVDDGSPAASFRAAAFLLVNRARPAGRAVLGLPCNLFGNGMLFAAELLRKHPWDAFTSAEDLEYAFTLRAVGVRPVFAAGAILLSPAAPSAEAAARQQLRWEGGRLHVAKVQVPRLAAAAARRRDPALLGAALELLILPLGTFTGIVAVAAVTVSAAALAGVVPLWAAAPWLVALACVPVYVLVGLRAARAPRSAYLSLARAPAYVLRKLLTLRHVVAFSADTWVRTERQAAEGEP